MTIENITNQIIDSVEQKFNTVKNELDELKDDMHSMQQRSFGGKPVTKQKDFDLDIKGFMKSEMKDFVKYQEQKSVNTGAGSGAVIVPEIIAGKVIEAAINNQIILQDIPFASANSSDYKVPYIETRPAFIQDRGENLDGSLTPLNDGQAYGEHVSKQKKFTSSVFFSHEIINYGVDDVQARFMKLLGEDFSGNLIDQYLNGDGGTLNFRGLLNARIDKEQQSGGATPFEEALKDDATRSREYYGAMASGTAGEIGSDTQTSIDNLIDLQTLLPSKYQASAKFYMSRSVFATIRKMIGSDGHPIFGDYVTNGADGQWLLLGKPVVLVDDMAAIGSSDALVMYGALGEASQIVKQFDNMINDPYTRPDGNTVTFNSVDSEVMGAFDSVRMLVAIA